MRSAGRRAGRPRTDLSLAYPQSPVQPKAPSSYQAPGADPDPSRNDRYLVWSANNPYGSMYDFTVQDFLLYQKRMSPMDFNWMQQVNDLPLDYYFPAKQMAWQLTSRHGMPVRFGQQTSTVDIVRAANAGIHVVNLHIENLQADPVNTLTAAWSGVQKP